MEQDLLNFATQFGAAGLIAWMWLSERRHAATREAQLSEAHERLAQSRVALDSLLTVVADNTRALASLEATQRALLAAGAGRPREHAAPDERSAA
ncbi:MAG: hypothetical protein D6693_07685 [Planctomycetota bacterium]|nr:MAG: hypothetical protein D6693_07685 [Planctomycetota bacterium]